MREQDKLLTLLTRNNGVIRAYASGAKSFKSKKGAATSLLSYSSFTLNKKADTYNVCEATPLRIFFGAGTDIIHLSLSQYFCELCEVLAPDGTDSEEIFRLILNSLHFLTTKQKSPYLIKAITELRLASISGYTPNLIACDGCGCFENDIMFLRLDTGTIYCEECRIGEFLTPLNITMLKSMRHIVYSKFNNLYSFDIPYDTAKLLSEVTEKYLIIQTEHKFLTLDFFNSINIGD